VLAVALVAVRACAGHWRASERLPEHIDRLFRAYGFGGPVGRQGSRPGDLRARAALDPAGWVRAASLACLMPPVTGLQPPASPGLAERDHRKRRQQPTTRCPPSAAEPGRRRRHRGGVPRSTSCSRSLARRFGRRASPRSSALSSPPRGDVRDLMPRHSLAEVRLTAMNRLARAERARPHQRTEAKASRHEAADRARLPVHLTIETIPTHLPLPAKIRTELLDPIHVDHDPKRVNDREYVTSIYHEVECAIQDAMDRIAQQRRFPVFA
jgi:hypothetical protein